MGRNREILSPHSSRMVKPNDYVLLVTDTGTYNGLNHWDMVNIFKSYGCTYATTWTAAAPQPYTSMAK